MHPPVFSRFLVVPALALAISLPVQAAQERQPDPSNESRPAQPSPAHYGASTLVSLQFDGGELDVNSELINATLASSAFRARLLKESKIQPTTEREPFSVKFELIRSSRWGLETGDERCSLVGTLCAGGTEPAVKSQAEAETLLNSSVGLLGTLLSTHSARDDAPLKQRLAAQERGLAEYRADLDRRRNRAAELHAQAGPLDVTRIDALNSSISVLGERRSGLELDLVGARARREAITQQLARLAKEIEAAMQTSPVLKELQTIVGLRQKRLELLQEGQKQGKVSGAEVNDAEEALARARADFAQQQFGVAQAIGANLLSKLNDDLVTVTIQSAESEALLAWVTQEIGRLTAARVLAERYANEAGLPPDADQVIRDFEKRIAGLKERLQRPITGVIVNVLGDDHQPRP